MDIQRFVETAFLPVLMRLPVGEGMKTRVTQYAAAIVATASGCGNRPLAVRVRRRAAVYAFDLRRAGQLSCFGIVAGRSASPFQLRQMPHT